MGEKGEKRD